MKKTILLLCLLFVVHAGYSQFEDDGDGPPVEDPPPPAPIDDWIPVLLVLGVAYTGYYFYSRESKQNI